MLSSWVCGLILKVCLYLCSFSTKIVGCDKDSRLVTKYFHLVFFFQICQVYKNLGGGWEVIQFQKMYPIKDFFYFNPIEICKKYIWVVARVVHRTHGIIKIFKFHINWNTGVEKVLTCLCILSWHRETAYKKIASREPVVTCSFDPNPVKLVEQ